MKDALLPIFSVLKWIRSVKWECFKYKATNIFTNVNETANDGDTLTFNANDMHISVLLCTTHSASVNCWQPLCACAHRVITSNYLQCGQRDNKRPNRIACVFPLKSFGWEMTKPGILSWNKFYFWFSMRSSQCEGRSKNNNKFCMHKNMHYHTICITMMEFQSRVHVKCERTTSGYCTAVPLFRNIDSSRANEYFCVLFFLCYTHFVTFNESSEKNGQLNSSYLQ